MALEELEFVEIWDREYWNCKRERSVEIFVSRKDAEDLIAHYGIDEVI